MAYSKPEIAVLKDAARVIHELGKGSLGMLECAHEIYIQPAYDLDE